MQEARLFKAAFFKALANPMRIAIIDALRQGERGVNDIAAVVGLEQAPVSQHLAVLRGKNIVKARKAGNFVYYAIRDPAIFTLLDDAAQIFNNHLVDLRDLLTLIGEA
jgi:DNA-binding transcriptional ArsR family regulator